MPPALQSRPEGSPEVEFVLWSFTQLNHFRQDSGFGISPLSFQDIVQYAQLVGYTDADDVLRLTRLISMCDAVYLKRASDKRKSQSKTKSKGGRRG